MKNYIFLILSVLLISCATNKSSSKEQLPNVYYVFKGIKPNFFKSLEKTLTKESNKLNLKYGFKYDLSIPEFDNRDYLDLPDYEYKTKFDYKCVINFVSIINKPYNPKEQQANSEYIFMVSIIDLKTKKVIENHNPKLYITSRNYYRSIDLAKTVINLYKKSLKRANYSNK